MGINSAALPGVGGSPLRGTTTCFSTGVQSPKARMGTQQLSPLSSEDGEHFFTSAGNGLGRGFSGSLPPFFSGLKWSQSIPPGSTRSSVFPANHPDSNRLPWASATPYQRHKLSLTDCFCELRFETCPRRWYSSLSSSHPPILNTPPEMIIMAAKQHFEKTTHENNQTRRGLKS